MTPVIIGDNSCTIGALNYGQAFSLVTNIYTQGLQVRRQIFCFAMDHEFAPRLIEVVTARAAKITDTKVRPERRKNRITMMLPLIGASQMFAPDLVHLSSDLFLELRRSFLEYQLAAAEATLEAATPRRSRRRSHR